MKVLDGKAGMQDRSGTPPHAFHDGIQGCSGAFARTLRACTPRGIAQFIDVAWIRAYLILFVDQRCFLAWTVSVTYP